MAAMDHGAWLVIKLICRLSIVFVIDIHVSLVLSWYIYVKFFYLKEAQQNRLVCACVYRQVKKKKKKERRRRRKRNKYRSA